MRNVFNWIEIPVADLNRAVKFYETILKVSLKVEDFQGLKMAVFPHDESGGSVVGGALVQADDYRPSETMGVLAYINGGDDLDGIISRIESAGGKITMPKMSIGPNGYIARFIDSEGNRIGLHAIVG